MRTLVTALNLIPAWSQLFVGMTIFACGFIVTATLCVAFLWAIGVPIK